MKVLIIRPRKGWLRKKGWLRSKAAATTHELCAPLTTDRNLTIELCDALMAGMREGDLNTIRITRARTAFYDKHRDILASMQDERKIPGRRKRRGA